MASATKFMIAAAMCAGMTVATTGTALASTPAAAHVAPAAVVTQPADWNNDNHDWDHDRDRGRGNWDWNRNHNGGWWGNRGRWGVSPQQCRWGGGRIDWSDRKCRGGRFGGERLRFGW